MPLRIPGGAQCSVALLFFSGLSLLSLTSVQIRSNSTTVNGVARVQNQSECEESLYSSPAQIPLDLRCEGSWDWISRGCCWLSVRYINTGAGFNPQEWNSIVCSSLGLNTVMELCRIATLEEVGLLQIRSVVELS